MRLLLLLLALWVTSDAGRPPPDATTHGGVWPLPQHLVYGRENRTIDPAHFDIVFDDNTGCDYISNARKTYKRWLFPFKRTSQSSGAEKFVLEVKLREKCPRDGKVPPSDMNEHYKLTISASGNAILKAEQIWGALRGLETFSHLIWFCNKCQKYRIRTAVIDDKPRFPVRGYMIDTSRHFLSVNTIKRQIDLMAQNKLNILHWHLVDTESFPYESVRFPELSAKGAYTPKHVYSQKTIAEIISHARLRGIRVVPEFDTPGHMGSWSGQPGLLSECFDEKQQKTAANLFDPTKDRNFEFLEQFFGEIMEVFADDFLHLGGDEVSFWIEECWSRNPKVLSFMEKHGFGNSTVKLENFYFSKLEELLQRVRPKNKRILYWQEVFDQNKPPANAIVHVWKGNTREEQMQKMADVTAAGHQAILSSCWYLNYINYGPDWKEGNGKFYYCDPRDFNGTDAQKALVLGGVIAMWGEFVDATNIEARTWPRASAVAERLWSDPEQTKSADVAWPRLHEFRCRMVARGFRAEPNNAPDFCPQEWEEQYLD